MSPMSLSRHDHENARAAELESALRELAGRCRDLDALIGPQDSAIYHGWKRAVDAADAVLED